MNTKMIRPLRILSVALGAVVLAVAVSLLAIWSHQGGQRAAAETGGQTDLAIAIDVNGDSINDCDTIASTGTGSTCTVVGNATFGVKELVRFLGAGITDADGDTVKEFGGMNWRLEYTAGGLMRVNSGTVQVLDGACTPGPLTGGNVTTDSAGVTAFFCHGSNSSFTGAVSRVDFACSGTGSRMITMKAAPDTSSLTWLHNENTHARTVSKDSDEMLTINCTAASVGGVAELAGIAPAASQAPSSGGGWAPGELAAIAAGSAVALASAAWYVRRRRAGARA